MHFKNASEARKMEKSFYRLKGTVYGYFLSKSLSQTQKNASEARKKIAKSFSRLTGDVINLYPKGYP